MSGSREVGPVHQPGAFNIEAFRVGRWTGGMNRSTSAGAIAAAKEWHAEDGFRYRVFDLEDNVIFDTESATDEPVSRPDELADRYQAIGLRFGFGALIVNTGTHDGEPAVIIDLAPHVGEVGAAAPDVPAGTLAPVRLVFPTAEQAQRVADALVNAPAAAGLLPVQIADAAVRSDIECFAAIAGSDETLAHTVYDTSRISDYKSEGDAIEAADLATTQRALRYIEQRGDALPFVLHRCAESPHLVWFEDRAPAAPLSGEQRMAAEYAEAVARG